MLWSRCRASPLWGRVARSMALALLTVMSGCQLPSTEECATAPSGPQQSCFEQATFRGLIRTDPISAYARAILGSLPGGLPPVQTTSPILNEIQGDRAEIARLRDIVERYQALEEQLRTEIDELRQQVPSKQTLSRLTRELRETERQRDGLREEVNALSIRQQAMADNYTQGVARSDEYAGTIEQLKQENSRLDALVVRLRQSITWYQVHEQQIDERPVERQS